MFVSAQDMAKQLYRSYPLYKETGLQIRRFQHKDILPLILPLKNDSCFKVEVIGKSTENRDIFLVKAGQGKKKVLLWSQMHGDEPTATMALFDIFRFLKAKDSFDVFRKQLLSECTLYFVPMLNPDGAEVFKRRTALDIDMNRDALSLQTPEGRLLKSLQQSLMPLVGFNLHDQHRLYSAGHSKHLATISLLAPAYNERLEINDVRKRAMQLIVGMNNMLQEFIPNALGRWGDEFEPRAFGDNIQKWGTSLVLIESGGYINDPEKQYIRKLNFLAMLMAFNAIATESYKQEDIGLYNQIPVNSRALFDLVIRGVDIPIKGYVVKMDLGINSNEIATNLPQKFYTKGVIEDMGDLSTFYGVEEINGQGLVLESVEEIKMGGKADFILKKGNDLVYKVKNGKISK
jgi:Zinc carboxypeptidase